MKVIKFCSTNIKACNWTLLKYVIPMAAIATVVLAAGAARPFVTVVDRPFVTVVDRPFVTVAAGADPVLEPKGKSALDFQCPVPHGFFKNPKDCRTYYQCIWGTTHLRECPIHLHWDDNIKRCGNPEHAGCD
ncbi:putative inactive cytidine deaminase 4 [Lobosporangium transversale]|uniref:Chitin-binding type-2 domain-containing protein n=1 Tax=Lobosporangium transversale TaxID=64571 RepID=A0A1Y2GNT9_9FUNG|nr:hypothetical protein BCR41DRAFT_386374 [Lobosporangium transversale]KAF9895646.1 putative inactive cytidine deaminase 4 [Lobosporangium transversale]ORZ16832.1 hypothetical protein BCR41DRAFT_386374 [Lobosporangium transversale]|eukprot:XP_021881767.1 hypothetical protein BCR41DRAFT_386374 [Lobosporangium transversale]